jgi:beta-1,4-mannosyltransferase
MPSKGKKNVAVVVLGDLGRSPRMQYHAISLAKAGFTVSLVGGVGESCVEDVVNSPAITVHRLSPAPWCGGGRSDCCRCPRSFFLLYAPFKVLYQIFQLLLLLLFGIPYSTAVLVQNPPSIPTLFVVWTVCRLRGSRFIIDWHNFGYTILELTLPPSKACGCGGCILRLARVYERWMGRRADNGLCVTRAMKMWLKKEWGVEANVLHDRPPSFFRRSELDVKHDLFSRLADDFASCESTKEEKYNGEERTLFTAIDTSASSLKLPVLRDDRPALVLSSTSWTPDEDFGVLLDAIDILRKRAVVIRANGGTFPKMVFVVTGKGPQRKMYEEKMKAMKLSQDGFHFLTMWLESSDYPLLLGSADMGVCLHTSSSGLDLPMKVVDMFGCQLPVCAYNFNCLDELVVNDRNGLIFNNSKELAEHLYNVFHTFPKNIKTLKRLASGAKFDMGWHENWIQNALPVMLGETKEGQKKNSRKSLRKKKKRN